MTQQMDKPLHVRVAEALGCKPVYSTDPILAELHGPACHCGGYPNKGPHNAPYDPTLALARYDTDWSATGPLIERYKLYLYWDDDRWIAQPEGDGTDEPAGPHFAAGQTPLIAVCNLILALHEAGKLPR